MSQEYNIYFTFERETKHNKICLRIIYLNNHLYVPENIFFNRMKNKSVFPK